MAQYGMPTPPQAAPGAFPHEEVNKLLDTAVLGFYNNPDAASRPMLTSLEKSIRNILKERNTTQDPIGVARLTVANFLQKKIGRGGKRRKTRRSRKI